MHRALNLENLHYFNGMKLNLESHLVLQSKIQEYCFQDVGNTVGDSKIQKNFRGIIPPDPPKVHVLFFRKMTMFLGALNGRQINNFLAQ